MADYDIVLIGSGMGALTVASLMAQIRGSRVLVIERHFRAGGYTHTFERKGFQWDVGLHYVGQMKPGSPVRRLMDRVTGGAVEWSPMAEPFERFRYPGLSFDLPGGAEAFEQSLGAKFPEERAAVRRYLRDLRWGSAALAAELMKRNGSVFARGAASVASLFLRRWMRATTAEQFARRFRDPALRAVLASQWGDYGLPPSRSPFALHAMIASHYLGGAWFPTGGAGTIAASVRKIVEERGGKFLLAHEVEEILVRDGRAAGVRVRPANRRIPAFEVPCRTVVSGAGAVNTYLRLLPGGPSVPFRDELEAAARRDPPATAVCMYIGFRDDPRALGFRGENYWLYDSFDHDAVFERRTAWAGAGEPPQIYLSFPSLKDPAARRHTAEAIAFTGYETFAPWRGQPWLRRGPEYQALKDRIAAAMLRVLDRHFPGFSAAIEYRELSTPLTNEALAGHPGGALYGLPFVPGRRWNQPRSPIPGLYLTGADAGMLGIVGAMMGGAATLSVLPGGISTPRLFR